ncbi:iron chelate uptake ABC transporter family permease subunit, partial [Corynebacterium sp. HMSC11E11]|uniref:iron chelate uptake ABC transporter family permease subunit n=1 Tax=Corynebacterium sp. HMSC11E11 TaxID=1581089 RepID=UPI000AC23498
MTTVVPHSVGGRATGSGGRASASVSASNAASRHPADPAADADPVAAATEHDRIDAAARARRRRAVIVHVVLAVALVATVLWSATVGQYGTGVADSLKSIVGAGGEAGVVMWQVRLPRIALALFVGAGLAIAGVALQAVFGNPLAEPGLVGVSSGATVGAAAVTVAGGAAL